MSKSLQSLIAFIGFVVIAIIALTMAGNTLSKWSAPAPPAEPANGLPASITLNMGGAAWVCNLDQPASYRCVIRQARPQHH